MIPSRMAPTHAEHRARGAGTWPSGDGARVYVGLENDDALAAIDTATNRVIATVPIGQAPQAMVYVPNAVPSGAGTQNLQPLGLAGQAAHLTLAPVGGGGAAAPTSVSLFDQGLVQILQAAVTGLQPKQPYVLALAGTDGRSTSVIPCPRQAWDMAPDALPPVVRTSLRCN